MTIKDSVITRTGSPRPPRSPRQRHLPGRALPVRRGEGRRIDTAGPLTLKNTVVSDNSAGGVASDAVGRHQRLGDGLLTVTGSRVSANRAVAGKPNGRFAEGGGIFVGDGVKLCSATAR